MKQSNVHIFKPRPTMEQGHHTYYHLYHFEADPIFTS